MAEVEGAPADDVFNVSRIRDLIGLMEEHELSEVDLKQGDQQIRLVRGSGTVPAGLVPAPAITQAVVAPAAAPPAAAEAVEADGPHIKMITSPMVGTFYSKPNPSSPEFVKVGSKISPDTVVCTVEAMKVFNEIPAEISGTVVAVLAKNEEAVDFGRPLFKVDTRG
jgi:acetyl-CoA carboxylase biotin carboxyl carrier protein